MNYPKAIKELRQQMLVTQEEFADILQVSFATVNRWENGHNTPTMSQRRKIAKLLKKNKIELCE